MNKSILVLLLALVAAGCDAPPEQRKAQESGGREETRGIRNTKNIGYSGDAIADKVDGALNAAEANAQQMKDAEAQTH